jgi:hypothetical protein
MHRPRLRSIGLFVVAAFGLIVSMFAFAPAATAGVAAPGCNAATTPGGQISQYPAWGATQSGWKAACVFQSEDHQRHVTDGVTTAASTTVTSATAAFTGADVGVTISGGSIPFGDTIASVTDAQTVVITPSPAASSAINVHLNIGNVVNNQVTSSFTMHDFPDAIYHNGAARSISPNGVVASGSTTFTAADCTGATGFVNRSISGTGIAPRTFVTSISGACLVTLNTATNAGMTGATVLKIDNSVARSVADGSYPAASTVITSPTGNCTAGDNNLSVSGTDIQPGTVVSSCNGTGWNISKTTLNGVGAGQVITIGGSIQSTDVREVTDATFTAIHTLVTPSARFVNPDDIGLKVSSFGVNIIPQPCYITGVTTATTVTVSCTLTVDSPTAHRTDIGEPTATAPANGDTVMTQATQLALDPNLVAGTTACNQDRAAGFSIAGQWANPGNFTINVLATQPAGTKAVGEVLFPTSVGLKYGAFIIERRALTAGDPQGAAHYDVVFPNVPTSSALCLSPTSPGLGFAVTFQATTLTDATLTTGLGRPGTGQVRAIKDDGEAGGTNQAFMTDDSPAHAWTGPAFNRICITPAGPATVDFKCGTG